MLKPKALFVLHLPPPTHGSSLVGSQVKNIMVNSGFYESYFIDLGTSRDVNEIGSLNPLKIFIYLKIILSIFYQLIFKKPRFVYFAITLSGLGFVKDFILVCIVRAFRVPLIFHLHNKGVGKWKKNFLFNFFYKWCFKGSSVILLSKRLLSEVADFVPEKDLYILPYGIRDRAQGHTRTGRESSESPVILFLSNLIREKGVIVLVDACKILKNKGLDFKCRIVGKEGDLSSDELTNYINSRGVSDVITYVGPRYGSEKDVEFVNSHVFAFPTFYHNETFGLVNLEAMMWSLPVVSTPEGGIPDIIEDGVTGFIVPQRAIGELADKLEWLIKSEKKRQEMGEHGRWRFEKKFVEEVFREKFLSILKDFEGKL